MMEILGMTPQMLGFIGLGLLLVLISLGVPIGFTFAIVGFAGLVLICGFGPALSLMGTSAYFQVANYTWTVLPLFMFMGDIAGESGLTQDSFYAARMWLGRLTGGLAIAVVGASTLFGAVSGSGIATVVTMTKVAWPEMRKAGYHPSVALGSCITGGCIDNLIPPSIGLILFAMLADESVGRLFIGGIFPGLLTGVLMVLSIILVCKLKPSLAPLTPPSSWKEKFHSLSGIWPMALLIFFVFAGIWLGVNTPNEAAGIGAFGAIAIGISRGTLSWKQIKKSCGDTAVMVAAIFIMFVAMQVFNSFISLTQIPQRLAEWIISMNMPPMGVLVGILLIYVILGIPLEFPPILLLTLPIFLPVLNMMEINLVWFGILTTVCAGLATITPPMGTPMFIVHGMVKADGVTLNQIFNGAWIFCIPITISLILLVLFPQITIWLPNLMFD